MCVERETERPGRGVELVWGWRSQEACGTLSVMEMTDTQDEVDAAPPATTAYVDEAAWLSQWLRRGALDRRSFERPLIRCDLSACRGMCCYSGVSMHRTSARVLRKLVRHETDGFRALGVALSPDRVTRTMGPVWPFTVTVTRTRSHPFSRLVDGYPAHFQDSACVFLMGDGRCSLQVFSALKGLHPWHYKPLVCVMQPIKLGTVPAVSLFLPNKGTDPSRTRRYPGYAVYTFCGQICFEGAPAYQVLQPELAFLGTIAGMDLLSGFG